jgi:2-dehydropantoate 2-reductase
MRYVVVGAGAVGGTVGARLADAGHDVVLVARGAHASAMREHGLRLATPAGTIHARCPVVDDVAALALEPGDVVLLATKTQDSTAVLDRLATLDVAGREAATAVPIVCVQNGVANERIALRGFRRVYGVVVMLPAVLLEPGRIDAQGAPYSGLLDIGKAPAGVDDVAERVAADLSGSGFVSRAVGDIMRWKYAKLLRNLGNSLEALCGHDLDDATLATVMELDARMRAEAVRCFEAAGIDWVRDEEWVERRQHHVELAPVEGRLRVGGSSWQSLARGTGSIEADHLNGEITLLGRLFGVDTPVNEALQLAANRAVHDGAPAGSVGLDAILTAVSDPQLSATDTMRSADA